MVLILEEHASEYGNGTFANTPYPELERFANLVYAAAAGMEREECARVCETPIDEVQITDDCSEVVYMDATECAAAIRARGNT